MYLANASGLSGSFLESLGKIPPQTAESLPSKDFSCDPGTELLAMCGVQLISTLLDHSLRRSAGSGISHGSSVKYTSVLFVIVYTCDYMYTLFMLKVEESRLGPNNF